jgi:hypothetical protein
MSRANLEDESQQQSDGKQSMSHEVFLSVMSMVWMNWEALKKGMGQRTERPYS